MLIFKDLIINLFSIFSILYLYIQNGLDNSGSTGNYEWVSTLSSGSEARYKHWEIRGGNWIGRWNQEKMMVMHCV